MRSGPPRTLPPLDAAALERLALRYVERFATTRGKLADYLARKLRERGQVPGTPEPAVLAERMATLGYIDDRGFAEARAAALTRRGYGTRRVAGALRAARVGEEDAAPALDQSREEARASALAFARRRRFGPFSDGTADERTQERQVAAMVRAGHAFALSRHIVKSRPGDAIDSD